MADHIRTRADWTGDAELDADVVVVGSGAGGAVTAAELAEGGLDVVLLEEGGHHPTETFTPEAGAMVRMLYRDGGSTMAIGNPPIQYAEGCAIGGSTVINGGMTFRTPARVLDHWAGGEHRVERIRPAEMARYFQRVEKFLSARPQDPETIGRDNLLLKEGAERKGWAVIDNVRDQLHCAGTNNCAFGCPVGAKRSTLVTFVPRALAFGARVYADCRVERILHDGGRVSGVAGRVVQPNGRPGARFRVRARRVVCAAGAIFTPALLRRSGFRAAALGRHLGLHPNAKVVAVFDEDVEGWKGVHQAYQVRQFQEEGFVMAAVNVPPGVMAMSLPRWGPELAELMTDYHKIWAGGVMVEDTVSGRVRTMTGGRPQAFYQLSDRDGERLVRGVALLCELLFAVGAKRIVLPFDGVPDLRGPDDLAKLAAKKIPKSHIEVMTVHMMGTARMGSDRERHVCDSFGRVYGSEGLYVSDASLFPTPIGVNPMETIMALAMRNAEGILEGR